MKGCDVEQKVTAWQMNAWIVCLLRKVDVVAVCMFTACVPNCQICWSRSNLVVLDQYCDVIMGARKVDQKFEIQVILLAATSVPPAWIGALVFVI